MISVTVHKQPFNIIVIQIQPPMQKKSCLAGFMVNFSLKLIETILECQSWKWSEGKSYFLLGNRNNRMIGQFNGFFIINTAIKQPNWYRNWLNICNNIANNRRICKVLIKLFQQIWRKTQWWKIGRNQKSY